MQFPQFQAHADMEERHWWFLARRKILRTLLHAVLPPSKEKLVIDVGCGTGGLTKFFSADYTVIGVDPSDDAIAFAKSRFPDCRFIHGHAPQDVSDFSRADAVLLIEVLEHVEDDVAFVNHLINAMKPGAYLLMIAPADMSLWSPHDTAFEHYRRYNSLDEFRRTWRGMPVQEMLVNYCNARLYPVVKLMRKLSALRGKSWGKGGTDISLPVAPVNVLLHSIFAGESKHLLSAVEMHAKPYRRGVSVMAMLRKL